MSIDVEIGLCTKDMAKENPVKDFEILIEEYKDKWSKQMYDYFKECLSEIKKELKRLEELDNGAYVSIHINRYIELCGKEDAFDALSKENEKVMKELSKEIERVRTLRLIKDKQDYALKTISDVIRDFNKGEFASAEIALQEITSLLTEVLNGD